MDDDAGAIAARGGSRVRWRCKSVRKRRAGAGGKMVKMPIWHRCVISAADRRCGRSAKLAGFCGRPRARAAVARRFEHYLPQKSWQRGPQMIDLAAQTALIGGVGGAGGKASKLCAALGMRVLGVDPRVTEPPPGMADLSGTDQLAERLSE